VRFAVLTVALLGILSFVHGGTVRFFNPLVLELNVEDVHCKGKSAPLQAWTGPEGSRKLRFPDLMTTAQDGGRL